MGYACPVCEVPQRDGEHLANHLAFTAMLREDDHEAWLDEHVPGWGDETPGELAGRVTDHAEEAEFDEVFEDTTGEGGGHEHAHGDAHGHQHGGHGHGVQGHGDAQTAPGGRGPAGFERMAEGIADEAVESVLEEARELTGEMYGVEEKPGGTEDAGSDVTDGEDDANDPDGADGATAENEEDDAGEEDAGDAEGNDS